MAWNRQLPLRFDDVDYLGHVSAATYLTFYEEARVAWLSEIWKTRFPGYVVAHQELHYIREVLIEDSPLTISIVPIRLGTTSFDVQESLVTASNDCKNESRATLVAWDAGSRQARPLVVGERAALEAGLISPISRPHGSGRWVSLGSVRTLGISTVGVDFAAHAPISPGTPRRSKPSRSGPDGQRSRTNRNEWPVEP